MLGSSLDEYGRFNVTTNIGTEFSRGVQLSEIAKDEDKIRDLAVLGALCGLLALRGMRLTIQTVSQRNVVFFRNQDLDIERQKVHFCDSLFSFVQ